MILDKLKIRSIDADHIPPNEAKAADIFARIGYRLEEALADLVDNSIDAEAKNVLIRFQRYSDGIHSVVIADDGKGMNDDRLLEAMRFGSQSEKGPGALGKYGIGLKSASLSQAQTVTVLSRQGTHVIGRRWTMENIRKGWLCERLDPVSCRAFLDTDFGNVVTRPSGTVIVWERLEHLRAARNSVDRVIEKSRKVVVQELGIKFHRLLAAGKVNLWVDDVDLTDDAAPIAIPIEPLDPFSHGGCGAAGYPKGLTVPLPKQRGAITMILHIWPPKTSAVGYRLGGGKVASRQGFYFYRNDRVIQAGGWNGLQGDDSEPHLSLARVEIDLPAGLESVFKLNIGKSSIDPPAEFPLALESGSAAAEFKRFLRDADATYRRQKKKESAKFMFTAGKGFSATMRRKVRAALEEKGLPTPGEVEVEWTELPADEVVRIDGAGRRLQLNRKFRTALTARSSNDAATLKLLALLLFQADLGKSFLTGTSLDRVRRINLALLATISE